MLEIQPFRLIGQSLKSSAEKLIENKYLQFEHVYSVNEADLVELSLRPNAKAKRLIRKKKINLVEYLVIEILNKFLEKFLGDESSDVTAVQPVLLKSTWQHLLTRFVLNECSPLTIVTNNGLTSNLNQFDWSFWSDEKAWYALQKIISMAETCANHSADTTTFAQAHEYLILAFQKLATTGSTFS